MLGRQAEIGGILGRLRRAYPAGFAIALHLSYAAPLYLFQGFDESWVRLYTERGFLLRDPVVRWALANTGVVRWSQLTDPAGTEVMRTAARHGLRFGFALALEVDGSRSFASFANRSREPSEPEIAEAAADLAALHRLTRGVEGLSPSFHAALQAMSVQLTRG